MLDKNLLKTVLKDWSYWDSAPPKSIRRQVLDTYPWTWDKELISVIQGVRRCGKSTFLAQLLKHERLEHKHCYFINFEDPRLSESLDSSLLDQILSFANEQSSKAAQFFFLDEIQMVEGWEKWLHTQVERPRDRYFTITGSNANLLGGKMSSALTGRHRTLELFPFNFKEFSKVKEVGSFEDYLFLGGFPKALQVENSDSLLREYFSDILERDARKWVATRNPQTLPRVAKAVFESLGNEVSLRKLVSIFDSTADSLGTYINAISLSYLIIECPFFTYSERKRAVHPSKYYPIDPALHRVIITRSGADRGKYLELVVFHALRQKYREIYFWKSKHEVDFVVPDRGTLIPIQVSWDGKKERHKQALAEFKKEFPKSEEPQYVDRMNVEEFLNKLLS